MQLVGFLWFLLTLLPLAILQRLLHREIQAILLILTRSQQLTVGLFSVLFFPGVFLHELSHFLMAKLLQVQTRGFSLIPHIQGDGQLLMGYVETEHTDFLRDSLIGLAPLIAGSLFIAYAGLYRLQIGSLLGFLWNGQLDQFFTNLTLLPQANDFFLWFYLAFAVSSTMMPSEADRDSWMPLGLWVIVLLGLALLAGMGPWMFENLAPFLNNFLSAIAVLFGVSVALHVALFLPAIFIHRVLSRVTGVEVA